MNSPALRNPSETQRRRAFKDEILGEPMAAILRTKTPAERLAMALKSWSFLRNLIRQTAAMQHPEWSRVELDRHVAERMLHGASRLLGKILSDFDIPGRILQSGSP